jgi:hypothetical protein
MAIYKNTPPIVTNGLVLNLDSLNPQSIPLDPTVNLLGNPSPLSASAGTTSYGDGTYAIGSGYSNHTMSYSNTSQSLSVEITHTAVWGAYTKNTTLNNYYFDTNVSYSYSFEWKIGEKTSGYNGSYAWQIVNDPATIIISPTITLKPSGSTTYNTGTLLPDGFYQVAGTFKPLTTGSVSGMGFRIILQTFPTGSQRAHFFWRNLQFEKIGYSTPFISGSRTSWQDLSGNNNTATLLSSSISSSIPQYSSLNGRVLNFDGTGSYAQLTRPVQDDFTLSCWFKTNKSEGVPTQWYNGRGLIDCEVGGYQNDFGLAIGGGRVIFGIGSTISPFDISIYSTTLYNDNKWHQATATRNKTTGTISLYVDSLLVASSTAQTGSLTSTSNMRIGSLQTGANYYLGSLSTVQIYNRVLSSTEVTQNYNATKARFGL